jgi:hypothetical protein
VGGATIALLAAQLAVPQLENVQALQRALRHRCLQQSGERLGGAAYAAGQQLQFQLRAATLCV